MLLKYHQKTYDLLTKHYIDPTKCIEELAAYEQSFIAGISTETQSEDELPHGWIKLREHRLAWTKLKLHQRPIQFSDSNMRQLDLWEQQYNIKFPASVREWYSLDIAPDIMTVRGWGSKLDDVVSHIDLYQERGVLEIDKLWFFLVDEYIDQGGEDIAFRINAGDDPPVVALSGEGEVKLADHFSEFIYLHFWDWYAHYTFEYRFTIHHHPGIRSLQILERFHISVERLREHFAELKNTFRLRFYDDHCRIFPDPYRLWQDNQMIRHENIITGGTFLADSSNALKSIINKLWGDNAPVFEMNALNKKPAEVIDLLRRDLLRRSLKEADDWISADKLVNLLGASKPIFSTPMIEQIDWLIEHGEIEAHSDNMVAEEHLRRWRLKR